MCPIYHVGALDGKANLARGMKDMSFLVAGSCALVSQPSFEAVIQALCWVKPMMRATVFSRKASLQRSHFQTNRIITIKTTMEQTSSNQAWGGQLNKYKIASASSLGGLSANVSIYLPPNSSKGSTPVLYYLAGLTCNEDTGAQKGGFLRDAAQHGIAIVFPDTSPRGAGIAGEEDDWVGHLLARFHNVLIRCCWQDFGTAPAST